MKLHQVNDTTIELTLDNSEGRGTLVIEEGSYGFYLFVRGCAPNESGVENPIAMIDFFHQSPMGTPENEPPRPDLIVYDTRYAVGDPLGSVAFKPSGTEIRPDPFGPRIHGRTDGEYWIGYDKDEDNGE